MSSWLVLVLPLLCGLRGARAADLDVFPQETIVPQCATLTALWAQPPPIHLHVQPGDSISLTNLVDLGVQNNTTFTTFKVALPIGQNFSFAYNTIAQPFTVFQSSVMQVGPGTSDCLAAQADPIVSTLSSSPSVSSSVSPLSGPSSSSTIASSATSASSLVPTATETTSAAVVPDSATSKATSQSKLTIGAVVGIVCAIAGVFLVVLAVFWNSHRRYMKRLADLNPDRERSPPSAPAPRFLAPILGRGRGPIIPFHENAPPPPSSPTKSMLIRESQSSSSAGSRDTIEVPISVMVSPQDPPKTQTRRLVLNSEPDSPTTPRVHTDGGVRIRHPEELPPLYHDYNSR
ncbi:hypothetical protein DFH09DRAFT_451413 [Mycena vulgaris]|nr:hypothetical protein DFH09DRAFT_451413 [Mycena vulgaris]